MGSFGLSASIRRALPQGRLLPDDVWRDRHRRLLALLWVHVGGLFVFALARGHSPLHAALEAGLLVPIAAAGSLPRLPRGVRAGAVALGLVMASAVLVHLSGGKIEAHFHYFAVVALLTLYQDWVPFLIAVGFVVLDHGLIAQLDPALVYDHAAALRSPFKWALIHGGFLVAACASNVVAWRLNEQHALEDALTKLPNRRQLADRLGAALARRRRGGPGVALLLLDLDDFKGVNDTLGHGAGDALLVEMARRLTAALRPYDTASRLGGDEFALLLEDVRSEADAVAVAGRVLGDLAEPYTSGDRDLRVGASVGIAVADDLSEPEDLLRHADLALYAAKGRGKGCHQVFDPSMQRAVLERGRLEADLHHALARSELVVHYQPVVELDTGEPVEVEALVRWDHPQRGMLGPADFIPIAEQTGFVVPIGEWVLRQACAQAAEWSGTVPRGWAPAISVNLSAHQLASADIVDTVAEALAEFDLAPSRLCLEITESALMHDGDQAALVLERLKQLGVQLAVDDFGTGYASLLYLRRLPVDRVKIDRSFVAGLGHSAEDAAIVSGVLSLAFSLGLDAVAEGVETTGQVAVLRAMGCHLAQGFHWSRPLPPLQLAAWFATSARLASPALPIVGLGTGSVRRDGARNMAGPPRIGRVLVVDDVDDHRLLIRLSLEQRGRFSVVAEAADGEAAVALASAHLPDLVLLDLSMPGLGGLEALPRLRRAAPGATFVVLTGADGPGLAAMGAGADGYLHKGLRSDELVAELVALMPPAAVAVARPASSQAAAST